MKKDIKFIAFTDAVSVVGIVVKTITLRDGSSFDYTGINTLTLIRDYGYSDVDFQSYTLRLVVDSIGKYVTSVIYGDSTILSFSVIGESFVDVVINTEDIVEAYSIGDTASFRLTSSALVVNSKIDMDFSLSTIGVNSHDGVLKLSQQIVKSLLSRSRSNRHALSEGSSVMSLLGQSADLIKIAEIMTESIEATESFFLKRQSSAELEYFALTPSLDDKLSSLTLGGVKIDENHPDRVEVSIQMVTLSGKAVTIPMVV